MKEVLEMGAKVPLSTLCHPEMAGTPVTTLMVLQKDTFRVF